jgi:hypothetical protein
MATDKQVNYILALASKKGLSVSWMDASWKGYASLKQRSGKVTDFLRSLNRAEASKLIDALK